MNGAFTLCMINFGVEVTPLNRSLDFRATSGGPILMATLRVGLYSLTTLAREIGRAMREVDSTNTYTISIGRDTPGQARISIETSGDYLDLLFGTGTRSASTVAPLIGFTSTDKTGALAYTGTSGAGLTIVPTYPPYDYQPASSIQDAKQSTNEATDGNLEIVSFSVFNNFEFKCKQILEGSEEYQKFAALNRWLLRGGPIEFMEDINEPGSFNVGIPLNMRPPLMLKRMTPSLYDYFETPLYRFRELV